MDYSLIDFKIMGDERGYLVALEGEESVPFKIRRVYYIYDTDRYAVRGRHAHHNLEQAIICVSGSCDFILDDGKERVTIPLNNPAQALYIKNNIWREFTNFSDDCVVMVLANQYYTPDDYIRDYNKFLEVVNSPKISDFTQKQTFTLSTVQKIDN